MGETLKGGKRGWVRAMRREGFVARKVEWSGRPGEAGGVNERSLGPCLTSHAKLIIESIGCKPRRSLVALKFRHSLSPREAGGTPATRKFFEEMQKKT